jgi:hypothetical protein
MMKNIKTKVEQDIERRISENADDEFRRSVLERARVFKTSWVELGEVLSLLARNKEYTTWGYKTLTEFCQKELHIREATVYKLVGNFDFLSSHEPALLKRDNIVRLPDPDSLRVLAKAKDEKGLNDEAYASLRESALTHGRTASTLHKKIRATTGTEGNEPTQDHPVAESELRRRIQSLITSIRLLLGKKKDTPDNVRSALSCLEKFAKGNEEERNDTANGEKATEQSEFNL